MKTQLLIVIIFPCKSNICTFTDSEKVSSRFQSFTKHLILREFRSLHLSLKWKDNLAENIVIIIIIIFFFEFC